MAGVRKRGSRTYAIIKSLTLIQFINMIGDTFSGVKNAVKGTMDSVAKKKDAVKGMIGDAKAKAGAAGSMASSAGSSALSGLSSLGSTPKPPMMPSMPKMPEMPSMPKTPSMPKSPMMPSMPKSPMTGGVSTPMMGGPKPPDFAARKQSIMDKISAKKKAMMGNRPAKPTRPEKPMKPVKPY